MCWRAAIVAPLASSRWHCQAAGGMRDHQLPASRAKRFQRHCFTQCVFLGLAAAAAAQQALCNRSSRHRSSPPRLAAHSVLRSSPSSAWFAEHRQHATMLRSVQRLLQPGLLQQQATAAAAACFSTSGRTLADDYSALVFDEVKQLTKPADIADKEIGFCAGVPLETYERKVRIFSPARTAGQQGLGNTIGNTKGRPWRIAFETQAKWINPLMGWTSTADPLENVARAALQFATKDEALAFCRKHGWQATVDEPKARRTTRQKRFNGYGENFSIKRAGVPDLSTLPSNRGGGASSSSASKQ